MLCGTHTFQGAGDSEEVKVSLSPHDAAAIFLKSLIKQVDRDQISIFRLLLSSIVISRDLLFFLVSRFPLLQWGHLSHRR